MPSGFPPPADAATTTGVVYARPYRFTLAEARYILSHVYCVHHLPESDGWVYPWSIGAGEALCCRCSCNEPADLRLYLASEREAREWLDRENDAANQFTETRAAQPKARR